MLIFYGMSVIIIYILFELAESWNTTFLLWQSLFLSHGEENSSATMIGNPLKILSR